MIEFDVQVEQPRQQLTLVKNSFSPNNKIQPWPLRAPPAVMLCTLAIFGNKTSNFEYAGRD